MHLALLLALIVVGPITACGRDGGDDAAPGVEAVGSGSRQEGPGPGAGGLSVGDCVLMEEQGDDQAGTEPQPPAESVVPCQEPHHFEVVGIVEAEAPPGAPYPAIATDASSAEDQRRLLEACVGQFESYAGRTPEDAGVVVLTRPPEEQAWIEGDRAVRCIATMGLGEPPGGGGPELEGSLRRS